jgi:hypothetical protein
VRRIAEELTRTPMAMGMRWVSLDGPNAAFSKLTAVSEQSTGPLIRPPGWTPRRVI